MLFRTHALFSLLIAVFLFSYLDLNKYLFIALVVFGGMIPDVDKGGSKINNLLKFTKPIAFVTRHRGIFHSLFLAIVVAGVVYAFVNQTAGIALFIGYTGHLLIDGLNHAGVNLIHPLKKLHISGFIETGGIGEHILTIFLAVVFLIKLRGLLF